MQFYVKNYDATTVACIFPNGFHNLYINRQLSGKSRAWPAEPFYRNALILISFGVSAAASRH